MHINYSKEPENFVDKLLDGKGEFVWVSLGEPNWWNLINSGMLSKKEYVIFEINEDLVKKPRGLKRVFGKSQRVISGDVDLSDKNPIFKEKI